MGVEPSGFQVGKPARPCPDSLDDEATESGPVRKLCLHIQTVLVLASTLMALPFASIVATTSQALTGSVSGFSGPSFVGSGFAINVQADTRRLEQRLTEIERRSVNVAASRALNRVVAGARLQVQDRMKETFDRPTPYAVRSVVYEQTKPDDLSARVLIAGRSWLKNSTPPANFMGPNVYGGERNLKSFERQLQRRGLMPRGLIAVPGKSVRLNRYGNVPQSLIVRMLADLKVDAPVAGYNRARTDRSTKRNKNYRKERFFVPGEGSNLPRGVWLRKATSGKIYPVFLFVDQVSYQSRMDFEKIVKDVYASRFDRYFRDEFRKVIPR